MPLAMAFAIASGATPAQGLYTAIVAGLATSLLGGTRVQISGPTGGRVPFMDATGLNTLNEIVGRLQKRHVRVLLCGIHPALRGTLDSADVTGRVGEQNLCNNMGEMARRVSEAAA